MIGYAIECALKASIARSTRQYDFPDKQRAAECFVHDLSKLMRLSGLQSAFEAAVAGSPALELAWAVAKEWNEATRYDTTIDMVRARAMYKAATARYGVLAWLRRNW